MRTDPVTGREVIPDAEYHERVRQHIAMHDALQTPEDAIDGRCMLPYRDCRCYWPLKESDLVGKP